MILDALGDATSVVNVGAGTGSYEPVDRRVVAVEPARTMIRQRIPGGVPVVQASAGALSILLAGLVLLLNESARRLSRGKLGY